MNEKGNISIHSENIFPIIKKWLYSDKDIFVREVISNGCDAISKLKRLVSLGEASIEENETFRVDVVVNKENKTIMFTDNGLGMTADEVKKYINQVAFSGAEDFINKYKDKAGEENQIIGHFGLGFYSVFMVAEKVTIDTLSFTENSEAVKWICAGGVDYEIETSEKTTRGTTVTLFLNDDELELLDEHKLKEIIKKHCSFLPYEIYLKDEGKETKEEKGEKEEKEEPLNDTNPLWLKDPKDCTDEEYKDFYKKVFLDYNEPLFWIHLKVDYPFDLKGILYFPKLKHELDASEGQIKLYNNQVFVADNIKEIIPEFLLLLKGVIDCSDLPLNVSRSFLQRDSNVEKISRHITKKVADKLNDLFKKDRAQYCNFWEDINPFIKYGCIREEKFYDGVKDIIIFKTTSDEYKTLKEYLNTEEKGEKKVFYVSDVKQQAQYIKMFKEQGMEALILNTSIDNHFISFLEMKENTIKFNRIDSDISNTLKQEDSIDEPNTEFLEKLINVFKSTLNKPNLTIKGESLKSSDIPGIMLLSEQSRRMQEMNKMFGGMNMGDMFKKEETLMLNLNNNLVKDLVNISEDESKKEESKLLCEQVYDLARMSQEQLDGDSMAEFIARSNLILNKLAGI